MSARSRPLGYLGATLLALILSAGPASAQTPYFWNAPTGGAGTWDLATQNWSDNSGGPLNYTWTNSGNEIANFGNTAGTVTLGTGITAHSLVFSTTGYTVTGNTLTLAGSGGAIDTVSVDATINSVVAGSVGLTKNGGGTLTLSGGVTNTYTGVTNVNAGTLVIINTNSLGATGTGNNTVVAAGASLTVGNNTISVAEAITLNGTGVGNNGALRKIGNTNSTWSGAITLGSATRINSDTSGLFTVSGAIGGGANNLTVGGTGNTTISGVVTMSGTLTKDGGGTLTLSGTNTSTLTGPVTITGGMVSIASTNNLGTTGLVTLNGGTLRQTNSGGTGGTFISATRGIAIGASGGTVDYSPTDPTFAIIYAPTSTSVTISGPGNTLTKTGVGEFRYQNAGTSSSTFSKLVVNQGLFRLGNVSGQNFETGFGAVPASPLADAITLNGGAIGTSYDVTLHANRGITLGGNGGTFNTGGGSMVVPGVISGGGTLYKGAGGTLTLNGVNTYTGSTTFGGTLVAASLADGGANSAIGASSNAASNLVLNGGTLTYNGAAASTDRLFSITSAGGTLNSSGPGPLTFTNAGAILSTDKATTNFTVTNGSPFVRLATGATPADLAGLAVGMPVTGTGIPAGTTVSSISATLTGFTLSANATTDAANTPLTFTSINRTLTLTGSNTGANTIAGTLADSPTTALSVTKSGAGTWILSGNNTYSGATTISAGTLIIQSNTALGAATGSTTVANNAALLIDGSGMSVPDPLTLSGTGISSGGAVRNLANNNTLSGAITLSAATRINSDGGTLTIASGITGGLALTIGGAGNTSVPSVINTASLTKDGNGLLTLTASNTYSGATNLNGGLVNFNSNSNFGSGTTITFAGGGLQWATGTTTDPSTRILTFDTGGATFDTNGNSVTFANSVGAGGSGGLTKSGTGTLILAAINPYSGTTTINGGTLQAGVANALPSGSAVTVNSGGTLNLNDFSQTIASLAGAGNVVLGAAGTPIPTLTTGASNASTTFSGVISGEGNLIKVGTGTMILTGNNTYDGNPTTINGGTLLVNGQTGTNSGTGLTSVTVNSGGTFGGNGRSAGVTFLVNTGGTLRGGDQNQVGTLTLNGILDVADGAKIDVRVNDSAPAPAAAGSGGSTDGTAPNPTSNNFINVTNGGLSGNLANLNYTIDGTGSPFLFGETYSYQIATVVGEDFGTLSITDPARFTAIGFDQPILQFSITGNNSGALFINFTPVPEPATVLGLAAGALGAGGFVRRRRLIRRA